MHICLVDQGYESWFSWSQFGSKAIEKVDKTSHFVVDASQWQTVRLEAIGGQVRLQINDRAPVSYRYPDKLGLLRHVAFSFKGYGMVDTLSITKPNQEVVYCSGF